MLKEDIEQVNAYLLDQIKRFPYFPSAPFTVLSPHTLMEEFPFDTHRSHYALEVLEARGDWDRIPPLGRHKDVWFHVPSLNAEQLEPSAEDIERGLKALEVESRSRRDAMWVSLHNSPSRFEVMETVARCHLPFIRHTVKRNKSQTNTSSVHSVAITLASFHLRHAGFTSLTFGQVANASGCSVKVVRAAVNVLSEAGLVGVVRGVGRRRSRFYPLFVQESKEAFAQLVGA